MRLRGLLPPIAWMLPAQKLVLLFALTSHHGEPLFTWSNAIALLPEILLATLLVCLGRALEGSKLATIALSAAAFTLALASWIGVAAWAFYGVPVSYDTIAHLAGERAVLRSAFSNPALLAQLIAWTAGFFLLWAVVAWFCRWIVGRTWQVSPRSARLTLGLAVAAAVALVGAVFGASLPSVAQPVLLMAAWPDAMSLGSGEPLDPAAVALLDAPTRRRLSGRAERNRIENVVILVVESVRFEQSVRFGASIPRARHFDRVYAHHPRSVKTLEALLFGIYPSPTYVSASWNIGDYSMGSGDSLPELLSRNGFEASYLAASHLNFENYKETTRLAGFREVTSLYRQTLTWGADASTLLASVVEKLEGGRARHRRQFVMAWTSECHFPYDFVGASEKLEEPIDRYRGCVQHLSGAIEEFARRLESSGLLNSSLLIVLGDHGQIFESEHEGEWLHGKRVHEASLHVPLLMVAPGDGGGIDPRLFQIVDVPATIVSALELPVPESWVGRDMLDNSEAGREFVVAVNGLSDGTFGLVERSGRKLVRDRASGDVVAYDVERDPQERRPIAVDEVTRRQALERMRAYVAIASAGWEERREARAAGTTLDRGNEIEQRWMIGPCNHAVTHPSEPVLELRFDRESCKEASNPFSRRLMKAFPPGTFRSGLRLRFRMMIKEDLPAGDAKPRALARMVGLREPVTREVEPVVGEWQTVEIEIPPPDDLRLDEFVDRETEQALISFVPIDSPTVVALQSIEVLPRSADVPEVVATSTAGAQNHELADP